jgi:hypothetical protein
MPDTCPDPSVRCVVPGQGRIVRFSEKRRSAAGWVLGIWPGPRHRAGVVTGLVVDDAGFEVLAGEERIGPGTGIDLVVDDTGDPGQLARRLATIDGGMPVMHLSCHGLNPGRESQAPA